MEIENEKSTEWSRIVATAEALGSLAADRHRFTEKSVLLTGEPEILATANGLECLLDSLRLLVRMVKHLTVRVPSGFVTDAVTLEADRICNCTRPQIEGLGSAKPMVFDAVLCVGATGRADLPWTVINSNGWLARVSSTGRDILPTCGQTNPIGAFGAACLGVAEVFKRLTLPLTESDPSMLTESDPLVRVGVRSVPFPSRGALDGFRAGGSEEGAVDRGRWGIGLSGG